MFSKEGLPVSSVAPGQYVPPKHRLFRGGRCTRKAVPRKRGLGHGTSVSMMMRKSCQWNPPGLPGGAVSKWTIEDVDTVIQDYGFHFEPALTQDEKMDALEQVVKYHNAAEGICWSTIASWLKHMYGNRLADDGWTAA